MRDTPGGIHDLAGNGREWTSTDEGDGVRLSKGMACVYELHRVDEQLDYLGIRCAREGGAETALPVAIER